MVREILKKASERLLKSETPLLDARILLAYAMGKSDAALIFEAPDENQLAVFEDFISACRLNK